MVSEVGTYLASQGQGTVGTDLFEGLLPPTPVTCTVLYERPGRPPVRASAKTIVAERPTLQIVVRSAVYETGYDRIKAARTLLNNFSGLMSGVRYLEIIQNQGIHTLGTDEARNFLFSLNLWVTKEPS